MTNLRTLNSEEVDIYWNSLLHPYRSQMFTPNEKTNVFSNRNKFLDSLEERLLSFTKTGNPIDINNLIIRNLLEHYLQDRTISSEFLEEILKLGLSKDLMALVYANKGTPISYVMNSGASPRTLFKAIFGRKEEVVAYGREELEKFGIEIPEVISTSWMWKILGWDPELEKFMRYQAK